MKLQSLFSLVSILAITLSCSQTAGKDSSALNAPSDVRIEKISNLSVRLSWKDNAPDETGYYVFLAQEGKSSERPSATLPADTSTYVFENLEEGTVYKMGVQAFGKDYAMSKLVWCDETYETPVEGCTGDPIEPEQGEEDPNPIDAIEYSWTEVSGLELPASVKVYKTEGTLNGRPLQAWYAVAKTDSDVRLKVLFPGLDNKKTIDAAAEADGKCLVLVNGGIFGKFNNGLAVCDGEQTPWARVEEDNWDVDRQYWGQDSKLHTVSRGLFGVDKDGKPGVYWSYTPSWGTVYVYDKPIPTVAGGPVLPGGSDTYPCDRASWEPVNAITCGPILLQNGRCPITSKKTSSGYWETNYELWADDIYGVNQLADRTSVGYLKDGRIVLCVVDGRIDSSQGANTLEMAAIMKGLGCVGALNLDGGGSTGMWAGGRHLNDMTTRKILTTIGFFSK